MDRINRETARHAEANDRLVERSARQLAQVRAREAKRSADDFIRELNRTRQAERQQSGGGGSSGGLGYGGSFSTLSGGRLYAYGGGGALAGVGALAVGFTAAAKAGVEYQETIERLTKSFESLLGSQARAAEHLNELRAFAARTPFEFEDVARASQRFQNMGLAAKDVVPLLTSVGNAVSAAGGGSEQIDRVSLALSQMAAKGKVSAEEMNQLAEAGVGGWQILERQTGKTKAELFKLAEAGELSAQTFLQAFRASYESGNQMQRQMETLTGATSTLKDAGRELLAYAFTPLHDTLRDVAVEAAKLTTEGWNTERALKAIGSAARDAGNVSNWAWLDKWLVLQGYMAGGNAGAAGMASLLGPPPEERHRVSEVNVPKEFQYKQKISDEDLDKLRNAETRRQKAEFLAEAFRKQEEAERKARQESERQADVLKRVSQDYAEASTRVSGFGRDSLQLEAALYKLSIGFHTLTDANQKAAQAEINRLFSAKRAEERLKAADELQKSLNVSIDEWQTTLRGGETARERVLADVGKFVDFGAQADETMRRLTARALYFADQKDFSAFLKDVADQIERIGAAQIETVDIPLARDQFGEYVGPTVDPSTMGAAPPNYFEEQVRRQKQMREMAYDIADIYGTVFDDIGKGWDALWGDIENIAFDTLRRIAQEILITGLTGQKSGAGGLVGLAVNLIGGALGGAFGGGLPSAGGGSSGIGASLLTPSSVVGGFASGTPSAPAGLHWVGERGPELMPFRGGERVFNNRDSMRLASGGKSVNLTVNFNGQNATPQSRQNMTQVARQLADMLSHEMERGG